MSEPTTQQTTPLRGSTTGEGWHLEPRRNLLFKVLAVLLALVFAWAAFQAAEAGKYLACAVVLLVALGIGMLPFTRNRRRLPARAGDPATGGLVLPVNPMALTFVGGLLIVGAVLAVAGVGLFVEGVGAGEVGQCFGALVTLLVGALMLLGAWAGIVSRRAADRGLVLTPAGVVLRTRRTPVTIPWDSIREVRAHWRRRRRGAFTSVDERVDNWLTFEPRPGAGLAPDVLRTLSGSEGPSLDATTLALDPYVALEVSRFYLAHPEARGELATDAGLARVAEVERRRAAQ